MSQVPGEESVRLQAVVRGRVQGVGFRDYVQTRAGNLRLTGFVRNLADGRSVEVVAEGTRASLGILLAQLRNGPRGAQVDAVEAEWSAATGEYSDFGATYRGTFR